VPCWLLGEEMIVTNGLDISSKDYYGRREDLSFIVRFNWKTSNHLKEAIQVLLAARLENCLDGKTRTVRQRSDVLDDAEFQQIRLQIASNPNTPSAVLDYLAKHASAQVLERIAENPRTTPQTLELLAQSSFVSVRQAVAENAITTPDVLTMLATDSSADVRYRIAENANVCRDTLRALTEDSNPYVSFRAAATLARIEGGSVVEAPFQERGRSTHNRIALSGKG
jgi:hypothetical protein